MTAYRAGVTFLLRVTASTWLPHVILTDSQDDEEEVYIIRVEPLNRTEKMVCVFEPGEIPGAYVTSILGKVEKLISCKVLGRLRRNGELKMLEPVSEKILDQIYECLEISGKANQKILRYAARRENRPSKP